MLEFFASDEFRTVVSAINTGCIRTLQLFFITLIGSLPLGLLICLGSMNRWAPLRFLQNKGNPRWLNAVWGLRPISAICRLVVWIVRGTPLVLQLIALFYVPGMVGWFNWPGGTSSRMVAACVTFIINYACYFSEIYRGGIQGVPVGQQEAGQVLGMTKGQIFFKVTLLQMVKRIVPPMANEVITLVKDTSLARIISFQEVIWAGYAFLKGSHGYSGLIWPLFFTGVYYLIFNGVVSFLLGRLERRLEFFR